MQAGAPLLAGIDAGTSSLKAVLIDRAGTETVLPGVPSPFRATSAGVEMEAGDLFSALRALLAQAGPLASRVAAVGIAGMAESGAPVGASAEVLAPILAWHDPRGWEVVARLEALFGVELSRRIGQRIRLVSSAAKLGWLIENGCPPVHGWLGVPELCLWRLTSVAVTEHSLASRTGWFDVYEGRYLREVAAAIGAREAVMAPVEPAGAPMGMVGREAAGWSGLPEGIPVTLAGHDHLAGGSGAGASVEDLMNSVGTAETVLRFLDAPPDPSTALVLRCPVSIRPGGKGHCVLAGAARAGFILHAAASFLGRGLGELDRLSTSAEPDAGGGRLVADIEAGVAPSVSGDPGSIWAGALEALATRTRDAAERIASLTGRADRMVVFGGGSKSPPWQQAKARIMAMPVFTSRSGQAPARGAALFAGVAAGWWPDVASAPKTGADLVA